MSHVTHVNESCHTPEWVVSRTLMRHVTHVNRSCHTYDWVMSHIWLIHVSQMNEKYHITHMDEPCHSYETVMARERVMARSFSAIVWLDQHWSCCYMCDMNTRNAHKSLASVQGRAFLGHIQESFLDFRIASLAHCLRESGVAHIVRLLKIIGLFCKRAL